MLQYLRAHHELAPRGRLLSEQIGEVQRERFGLARLLRQLRQRHAAKLAVLCLEAKIAREHGAHLRGVDAQVDPPGAELQRLHLSPQRNQARRRHLGNSGKSGVDHRRKFTDVRDPVGAVCRQRVGGGDQQVRVRQVSAKALRVRLGLLRGALQAFGKCGEGGRRLYACEDVLQCGAVARELHGFLPKPQMDRAKPGNVRTPIKVIADPAGNRRQGRAQILPRAGKSLAGNLNHLRGVGRLRLGGVMQRVLRFAVLRLQSNRLVPGPPVGLDEFLQRGLVAGRGLRDISRHRRAQVLREGEGRVGGEDDAAAGCLDGRAVGVEAFCRE